jgi:hypothetical protein
MHSAFVHDDAPAPRRVLLSARPIGLSCCSGDSQAQSTARSRDATAVHDDQCHILLPRQVHQSESYRTRQRYSVHNHHSESAAAQKEIGAPGYLPWRWPYDPQ